MKRLGYALLALGFLAGAFASVARADVPWAWYVPALLLGLAGVVLARRAEHAAIRETAIRSAGRGELEGCLARLAGEVEDMLSGPDGMPPWEYRFEIDRRLRRDLDRFAEARYSLSHLYGLGAFAEIMSAFAAGERYLNRVWSASADGYMDEARSYLEKALVQLREAAAQLEAAKSGGLPEGPGGAI